MTHAPQVHRPAAATPPPGARARSAAANAAPGFGNQFSLRARSAAGLALAQAVVSRSTGEPLPAATRQFMEPRLRRDLSQVRIHTDAPAARSARSLDAAAYTVGEHIAFGAGVYQPDTPQGRRILAHELAHTTQPDSPGVLRRWKIKGNVATSNDPGDTLSGLALRAGGRLRDWKCIRPLSMRTATYAKPPANFNDHYELYVQNGDTFDISNLTATTGASVNMYLFSDGSQAMDANLAQLFYPGSTSSAGADTDLELASGGGATPIANMVIFGHAGGNNMWGGASTFTPADFDPEEPVQSFALAEAGLFPRRCWFTRNAEVRSVGCNSDQWGTDFAAHYLRKGASVTSTTKSVRPKCSAANLNPATNTCNAYDGTDFATSPSPGATSLDGPFWSAGAFHGGRFWTTIKGKL